MSEPKLHHYVPQYHLKCFGDQDGRFFVWDKMTSRVYPATSKLVAAQSHFYRVPEFVGDPDMDPLFLEKNFSQIESDAARIHRQILESLSQLTHEQSLNLSRDDRDVFATSISLQFLRTASARELLTDFAKTSGSYPNGISKDEEINLHARLLCDVGGIVEEIGERISRSIWVVARNTTSTPFWISDNPVCVKTGDNKMWLRGPGIMSKGSYFVYPLNPEYILYCKEPEFWEPLRELDSKLSPVTLTEEMVQHENSGQVFMATRHVISPKNDFAFAEDFAKSIGTDLYSPRDM